MNRPMKWFLFLFALTLSLSIPLDAGAMLKHIERVTPRIGQRGTTVEVLIQGAHLDDPREIIFDRPGIRVVAIEPMRKLAATTGLAHGGRIEQEVRCRFEIAPDCLPGEHRFRLRTATQLSSLATFHVTPFVVLDEKEGNNTMATAQVVPGPVTVRGSIDGSSKGDIDLYRVPARAGERLSVEVDCVRLADVHYGDSEFDLALRVLDASGRELASNDENSLHSQDPLVTVKLPNDISDHLFVEVRRSVFETRPVTYALHIGSFERPLAIYPAGGPSGEKLVVTLLGDALGERQLELTVPHEPGDFSYYGDAPSALRLRSFPAPNLLEDAQASETVVSQLPAALHGILDSPGDTDKFRVAVKRGERYRVRVLASGLGSPLDPAVNIYKVGESKPEISGEDADLKQPDRGLKDIFDPTVIWEPKEDGDYLIELRDTNGFGAATGVYCIEIDTPPDIVFAQLRSVANDGAESGRFTSLAVPQGNRWTFNLTLPTSMGTLFQGDMEVVAEGLPAGVSLLNTRIPGGSGVWPVQLLAAADAQPGGAVIRLGVQSTHPVKKIETASLQRIPFINHSGGNYWRAVDLDCFIMAVTDAAPFAIELQPPSIPLVRGGELAIPVKLIRNPGFTGPIEFKCDFARPGIILPPAVTIPGDQSEAVLQISAEANAALGISPIGITATTVTESNAYLGTGETRVSSQLIEVQVAEPFLMLASDPAAVRRGGSVAYRWNVTPKSHFDGEADVKLLGLPKGVSVREPWPRITNAAKEVVFQVEASDEALLGPVNNIECEIIVRIAGQEIRQRTGKGVLRIDPKL